MESLDKLENFLKTSLHEIDRVLSTKTVVGEPITIEGNTVIPLTSMGFGFGVGGGAGKEGKKEGCEGTGAGTGGGGGIKPVAVIVINKEGVRVEPIKGGAASVIEKVGEAVGKVMEKQGEKKEKGQDT